MWGGVIYVVTLYLYCNRLYIQATDKLFQTKKLNEIIKNKHTHLWSDPPRHLKVPQSLD